MPTINIDSLEAQDTKLLTPKQAMLESLASRLEQKFHEYTGARQNKEDEWIRAIHQYEGRWDSDDKEKLERVFGANITNSPPPVNITRPKTNIAISRMIDSQFPVGGDYNFFMQPTPVPKLIEKALNTTDPDPAMLAEGAAAGIKPEDVPSPQQVAQIIINEADESARLMTLQIQDNFVETGYGKKARRAIEDFCVLGTAIIKGPVLSPHVRKMYSQEITSTGEKIQVLKSAVEHRGDIYRVDPRLFYPDPSARFAEEIEDCFELHLMSKGDMIKLGESPAFMRSQLTKAIAIGPVQGVLPTSITETSYLNSGVITKNRYVVKEYHGPIDKQDLYDGELISEDDLEDELTEFYGEVWICNGVVIRLGLDYLEGQTRVPYGVAAYERDPGFVFGHGVPFLLRHPQRVINNAYVMLLDNASLTSGPQIVLNKEMIEPASRDGNYDIEPMKVWFLTDFGADVREAIQFVDVPTQIEGILRIMDMAMQFADVESSTPLMSQGELPAGNNTLTGVAKVMSATNINQKRASMNWDDNITIPLVEREYHHEMQYGDNEEAKGDQQVKIGGATERIDAELHAQELERLIGLAMSNEEFQLHVDPGKAFRQLITLIRAGDILRSEDEIKEIQEKAAQEQGQKNPDPEGMKAQAALITAQSRAQRDQMEAQVQAKELELKQMEIEAGREAAQIDALARREQAYADMQVSQDRKDTEMAKLALAQDKTVKELENSLKISSMNNETARTKLGLDLVKFREEIAIKTEKGSGI